MPKGSQSVTGTWVTERLAGSPVSISRTAADSGPCGGGSVGSTEVDASVMGDSLPEISNPSNYGPLTTSETPPKTCSPPDGDSGEDADALRGDLGNDRRCADWQVTVYGQGFHAFTAPDIGEAGVPDTAYDPLLDRLSWMQATASLEAPLKS